jgi:hypothetical protein
MRRIVPWSSRDCRPNRKRPAKRNTQSTAYSAAKADSPIFQRVVPLGPPDNGQVEGTLRHLSNPHRQLMQNFILTLYYNVEQ